MQGVRTGEGRLMYDVDIRFCDGTHENLYDITEERIDNAVVTFWSQTGQWAPRMHQGSFPLANISRWKKVNKDGRGGFDR